MLFALNKMIYIQDRMGNRKKINNKEYAIIREAYSKSISGKNSWMAIEENRQKYKENYPKGQDHHWFNKKHSEETILKMQKPKTEEGRINIKNGIRKAIGRAVIRTNPNTNEIRIYECMNDAVKEGFNLGGIWDTCNGRRVGSRYKGYFWKYKE